MSNIVYLLVGFTVSTQEESIVSPLLVTDRDKTMAEELGPAPAWYSGLFGDLNWKECEYMNRLHDIVIADPKGERVHAWSANTKDPASRVVPAEAAANWVLKRYPTAFDDPRNPQVKFVGFDVEAFLYLMGIECSMPHVSRPLPLGMWYKSNNFLDIHELVQAGQSWWLSLDNIIRMRRPRQPEDAARWDQLVKGWEAPGHDAVADSRLVAELASQLGLIVKG